MRKIDVLPERGINLNTKIADEDSVKDDQQKILTQYLSFGYGGQSDFIGQH